MWVRRAAIRPVPLYARVPPGVLGEIESDLADEDEIAKIASTARLPDSKPPSQRLPSGCRMRWVDRLTRRPWPWAIFSRWRSGSRSSEIFEGRLTEVLEEELVGAEQSLALDEELRRVDPAEAVDSDDVVAMEQPDLLSFVHEHLDNALEAHAGEVDVDDVHTIYRRRPD